MYKIEWNTIPSDVIYEICSHLDAKSIINFHIYLKVPISLVHAVKIRDSLIRKCWNCDVNDCNTCDGCRKYVCWTHSNSCSGCRKRYCYEDNFLRFCDGCGYNNKYCSKCLNEEKCEICNSPIIIC